MGFLEDFIYKPEQQQVMKTAIGGALNMLKASVDEVDRNINLSKLLTYKRIQFQRIDITNIAYSLSSLLNNSQVISLMGGSKNMSLAKRREVCNSMTALEQANILDMAGYYLELTDNILASLTDDLKKKKFDIIDFQLCDGIAAGALPNRVLVHILNLRDAVRIALKSAESAGNRSCVVDCTVQGGVEHIAHE